MEDPGRPRRCPSARRRCPVDTEQVVRALGLPTRPGSPVWFTDTGSHWVTTQGWLTAAEEAGIIMPEEFGQGLYEPDRSISRQLIAVMAVRAMARLRDGSGLQFGDRADTFRNDAVGNRRPVVSHVAVHHGRVPSTDLPSGKVKRIIANGEFRNARDLGNRTDSRCAVAPHTLWSTSSGGEPYAPGLCC